MSMNPLNDISSVYLKEVLKPQLGKDATAPAKKEGGEKPSSEGGEKKEGDASTGSAKRIRQAVYDIRYRARREEIPVQQAYNQYMSHTTMTGPEKSEVKSKLGEEKVFEAIEEKKFQVRVTDKNSGKSYVRMATREKINQLRSNPNISSVEMTKYGSPYEGEKKRGEQTAAVKSGKGLAKKDYDGDGKVESGAKEHAGAVHNAIQRKKGGKPNGQDTSNVKEGFSNWRQDLVEVVDEIKGEKEKKIKEKSVKNKIVINPPLKEAVENLGGELLEVEEVQIDEVAPPSAKAERMVKHIKQGYAKDGKLTKKEKSIAYATAWKQYNKEETEIDELYKGKHGQSETEYMDSRSDAGKQISGDSKRSGAAYSHRSFKGVGKPVKPGERQQHQGKMTPADRTELAIRKANLKKEELEIEEGKQPFPAKKVAKQMEKARKGSVYGKPFSNEPAPNVSDTEKKETRRYSKMFHASEKAKREKQNAAKASRSSTFYRDTHPASAPKMKKANEEYVGENLSSNTGVTKEPSGNTSAKPAKTQSVAQDAQRKQQVQQLRTMMMKKRQLQNQELSLQKQGKLPVDTHATEEFHLDEKTRYAKETGINFRKQKPQPKGGSAKNDKAFQIVSKMMGSGRLGVQPRGKKKEPGKKPPAAGEYGGPRSPAQKVAARRADAQRAKDNMSSRFD